MKLININLNKMSKNMLRSILINKHYSNFFKYNPILYYDNDHGINKSKYKYDNNANYEVYHNCKQIYLSNPILKTNLHFDKLKQLLEYYDNYDKSIYISDLNQIDLQLLKESNLLKSNSINFSVYIKKDCYRITFDDDDPILYRN